jgi:peptidoglycan-N-acetylglucosamine deacetylase
VFLPRVLDFLKVRSLTVTVFVVGQDAALAANRDLLRAVAAAGHEIGNHSFHHEPWMQLYSAAEVERDIRQAEEHIERATGRQPVGFRGPGFSLSTAALEILAGGGYLYDASTFPTFLIPLARAYYFLTARLSPEEKELRRSLGGTFAAGWRPLKPYRWQTEAGSLIEIPVTTMPVVKVPIHASYLMCLAVVSPRLALRYFATALRLCRWTGTPPSVLLHPTDFLGRDDAPDLAFFPGMRLAAEVKLALLEEVLKRLAADFTLTTLEGQAQALARSACLPLVRPNFPEPGTRVAGKAA